MRKRLFSLCSFLILLSACSSPDKIYEEHFPLKGEVWEVEKMLPFEFTIDDTVSPYRFGLNFRYTENYPYQDIYLFLQTTFPDGKLSYDTLHCDLFSPEGEALGKGHRIKELETNYSLLKFPMKGKYVMRYIQAMRTDTLEGVESFGISLSKKPLVKQ